MHPTPKWLASRAIVIMAPDGKQTPVTLRIGIPYELSPEEWACPLAMEGFQERFHDIHGVDAWQALQLVQNLQAQLLGYFIQDGGTILCHEPPEPIDLEDLFLKLPVLRPSNGS
jgi:hypothetical protein